MDTPSEIKSLWRALDGNIEELTKRIDALEQRLPRPIPVVTPLIQPVPLPDAPEPESIEEVLERHGFCDRGDGWHEPLAPAPDYRSGLPAEVERCSCEESEVLRDEVRLLRAELGSASLELRQMAGRAEEAVRERDEARAYAVSCSTQAQTLSAERDAANAQLKQIRAVVAEAYTAPSRAKLREHAWRYLDAARDILAEQPAAPSNPSPKADTALPAEQGAAPATPDSGALYARSEEPAQCKCPGCRNGFAYCFTADGGEPRHA